MRSEIKGYASKALAKLIVLSTSAVVWFLLVCIAGSYFVVQGVLVLFGVGPAFLAIGFLLFALALFIYKGMTNA